MGCSKSSTKMEIQTYLKKQEKPQINNLALHQKEQQQKKEQMKPKVSRKKEIIKIRVEINERLKRQ